MAERKAATKQVAVPYRKASKEHKGVMLSELCALTGWNRTTPAGPCGRRRPGPVIPRGQRRVQPARKPRAPVYDEATTDALRVIWVLMDFPCGKRLQPVLADVVEALERHWELNLAPEVRSKLMVMSAATIDRRLAGDRKRFQIRGRTGTKPGSLLKGQIPIRTFSGWEDTRPGFMQADLVAHCGSSGADIFCQTLTLTDVATGWTEPRALKNKARVWVTDAIDDVRRALPFALLGLDCDNGAEFINHHLLAYCETNRVTFTRGRPFRKNDSCYAVEQNNWAIVRQAVGYARHETDAQLAVLEELYRHLRLFTDFFCPRPSSPPKAVTAPRCPAATTNPPLPTSGCSAPERSQKLSPASSLMRGPRSRSPRHCNNLIRTY